MVNITIGNTPLTDITKEDLLEIVVLEGCCPHISWWGTPEIVDFNNTIFSTCVVLDHISKRISDGLKSDILVFYFETKDLTFHWHKDGETSRFYRNRIGIDSIKFLIKKGYNVPIY